MTVLGLLAVTLGGPVRSVSAQEAQPAPTTPTADEPAPQQDAAGQLDRLLDELSKIEPRTLQAHLDTLRAAHGQALADAEALRRQADQAQARAVGIQQRINLLTILLRGRIEASPPDPAPQAMAAPPAAEPAAVGYEEHVKPLLVEKCGGCHNPDKAQNDLVVDSFEDLMRGGSSGKVVAPGNPDASLIWQLVDHRQEPHMPFKEPKLPPDALDVIRRWIEQGALREVPVKESTGAATDAQAPASAAQAPIEPQPLPTPSGRAAPVHALAADPSGPRVALPGFRQIHLFNLVSGTRVSTLPFPEGRLQDLQFSADGRWLLAAGGEAGRSGRAVVFDVATGERLAELEPHYDSALCAAVDPYRELVAVGGSNERVRVHDLFLGTTAYDIGAHNDWITALAFSPDATLLASADRAGNLFVWEAETGRLVHELRGHAGPVHDLAFRPDSVVLASAGDDGTARLWDMNNGGGVKQFRAHNGPVLSLDFAPDGRLCTAGGDGAVKLWNQNGEHLKDLHQLGDWVYAAVFSSDGRRVLAGNWHGDIVMLDADSAQVLGRIDPYAQARSVAADRS